MNWCFCHVQETTRGQLCRIWRLHGEWEASLLIISIAHFLQGAFIARTNLRLGNMKVTDECRFLLLPRNYTLMASWVYFELFVYAILSIWFWALWRSIVNFFALSRNVQPVKVGEDQSWNRFASFLPSLLSFEAATLVFVFIRHVWAKLKKQANCFRNYFLKLLQWWC